MRENIFRLFLCAILNVETRSVFEVLEFWCSIVESNFTVQWTAFKSRLCEIRFRTVRQLYITNHLMPLTLSLQTLNTIAHLHVWFFFCVSRQICICLFTREIHLPSYKIKTKQINRAAYAFKMIDWHYRFTSLWFTLTLL